ncbi:hypothetical protein SAMN05892877_105192 [Rhizobium subbaraonis]|uniref:Uncharacterized protein n=1 Tax=Rhizobium subbaraonis TaxID=908946 RepID=A0A285UB43_9HYPH|nr:hypothetical protein SAMN05892877_105192 [Rhizobium subbaraonis]
MEKPGRVPGFFVKRPDVVICREKCGSAIAEPRKALPLGPVEGAWWGARAGGEARRST